VTIFEGALPSHNSNVTPPPQVEIDDSDTPPRVQITVSPLRVPKAATPLGVVQPNVSRVMVPIHIEYYIPLHKEVQLNKMCQVTCYQKQCSKPIMFSLFLLGQLSKQQKLPPRMHQLSLCLKWKILPSTLIQLNPSSIRNSSHC
jgi:hypothetical protein